MHTAFNWLMGELRQVSGVTCLSPKEESETELEFGRCSAFHYSPVKMMNFAGHFYRE